MPEDGSLSMVQVSGLVIIKIIRHVQEAMPNEIVTGSLFGLDVSETLEVTNYFPHPPQGENEAEAEVSKIQLSLMELNRLANIDTDFVGGYTSSSSGGHINENVIQALYTQQLQRPRSILLVYDVNVPGSMGFKALRLSKKFMSTFDNSQKEISLYHNLSYSEIYEEIPVSIVNVSYVRALVMDMKLNPFLRPSYLSLGLNRSEFYENTLYQLIELISSLQQEQAKSQAWLRHLNRTLANQNALQAKRKAENTKSNNQQSPSEAPETEIPHPKMPHETPKLDSLFTYCLLDYNCQQVIKHGTLDTNGPFAPKPSPPL